MEWYPSPFVAVNQHIYETEGIGTRSLNKNFRDERTLDLEDGAKAAAVLAIARMAATDFMVR
jgi:hypothetical protein